tara:strand:- start:55 stop:534 length:480 start_codon:yes stop_codon:yes gene_type:complete
MNFIHTENHYPIAKDVIWEEVFDKIDEQYQIPDLHVLGFDARPHTIIIKPSSENGEVSFPPSLTAVKEAIDRKVYDMQFYFSLGRNASVYPSHRDKVDVFLVQSKGTVTYVLEEGEPNETTVTLNPGDSLFLPCGLAHCARTHGPRLTFSFAASEIKAA